MPDDTWPRFIVFEGPDGGGKSTQAHAFACYLASVTGEEPLCLREPTDGPWGRQIRAAAQNPVLPSPEELVVWFTNDRREDVEQNIRPALAANRFVVLDRYFYSTAAYQGAAGLCRADILRENRAFAPEPDLCFVLFCDPTVARRRILSSRGVPPDAFETLDYQIRVVEQYRAIVADVAAENRCPMIAIDTTHLDAEAVARLLITNYVRQVVQRKGGAS